MIKQEITSSIRISKDLKKKLLKIKLDLDCKSVDEVIKGLLKNAKKMEKKGK